MKFRRIVFLFIVLAFIASLCSCAKSGVQQEPFSSAEASEPSAPEASEADVSADAQAYARLTDIQRSIYARILAASENLNPGEILLPPGTSMADVDSAFSAVMDDEPSHFWLQKSFSVQNKGDRVYVSLDFLVETENERSRMRTEVEDSISEALGMVPDGADEFESELILHDWLVARVEYDDTAAADQSGAYANAYTVYGALVEQKAVCEGYARAMQLLLSRVGITAAPISGRAGGNDHMWNLVTIDGAAYHLDATFDDSVRLEGDQQLSHAYFNVTDEYIGLCHSDFLPAGCAATDANYFVRKHLLIDTYDEAARNLIISVLVEGAVNGERMYEFRFATDEAYRAAYKSLMEDHDIHKVLKTANEGIGQSLIDESTIRLGGSEEARALRILALMISLNQ